MKEENYVDKWIMSVVIILGLTMFVPVARAQQPYDITECYSFVLSVLQESQEVRILGLDAKGIVQSNHVNKVFDSCTIQTMGIRMDMKGVALPTVISSIWTQMGTYLLWRELCPKEKRQPL